MSHDLSADFKYLVSDHIGDVLAEGLTVLYEVQPEHPIDFYAKWLLNYCSTQHSQKLSNHAEDLRNDLIKKFKQDQDRQTIDQAKKAAMTKHTTEVGNHFTTTIQKHEYHEELLPYTFPNYVAKQLHVPGVYIGKLEHPIRAVRDDDEEELAHLEAEQQKTVLYVGASENHQFLIGKRLPLESGVTYEIFKLKEKEPPTDGSEPELPKEEPIYIPDVTKDARMIYHRIPKLGAFYASPVIFQSLLQENLFMDLLKERVKVSQEKEAQKAERDEFEKNYQQKLQDMEEAGQDTADLIQSYNDTQWPEIKEADLQGVRKEYALCADTLGEDRPLTPEEMKFIDQMASLLANSWEETEKRLLSQDVDYHLKITQNYNAREYFDEFDIRHKDLTDDKIKEKDIPNDMMEEEKNYHYLCAEVEALRSLLQSEDGKDKLKELKQYRVLRFRQLIQNAFYLLGYTKEEINLPETNYMNWKEARHKINDQDFFDRIRDYVYQGPRGKLPSYALGSRIYKRLLIMNLEEIDEYNAGLGMLYRFMKKVLEARELDIKLRKAQKSAARQLREEKLKEEEELATRKQKEFDEFKAAIPEEEWTDDKETEFEEEFKKNNEDVVIPPEVEDDIDEDWDSDQ
jgi:hypothetical protein